MPVKTSLKKFSSGLTVNTSIADVVAKRIDFKMTPERIPSLRMTPEVQSVQHVESSKIS